MAEAAQAAPAPKPGEVQINVGLLNGDENSAAEALAGLFADEERPESENLQQGQTPAADTEQEETPAIGDTEEGQSEQQEAAAIEPPVSWTAKEKEDFRNLPPEAQAALAPFLRRESERDSLLSVQSQKSSDEQKRLDAVRTQLENDRVQQVTFLNGLLFQLQPELARFNGIDWDKLAAEKPAEWAQQRQAFESLIARGQLAQQQIVRINEAQKTERETQHKGYLAEQFTKLVEKVPEWSDRAKFQAFGKDVTTHMTEFTPQEIGDVSDHRLFLVLRDAVRWRQQEAARAAAKTKLVPNAPSQARRLAPVARQGSTREESRDRDLGALHDNLAKTGSFRDAAALLARSGMFDKA